MVGFQSLVLEVVEFKVIGRRCRREVYGFNWVNRKKGSGYGSTTRETFSHYVGQSPEYLRLIRVDSVTVESVVNHMRINRKTGIKMATVLFGNGERSLRGWSLETVGLVDRTDEGILLYLPLIRIDFYL